MSEDCLFCKISAGTIPAKIAYQDEHCVAFHDINPQAPVHVLVIPRKHVPSVADIPDDLCAPLLSAADKVARDLGVGESYRLVTNKGADAGQSVFHLHWHVLGGRRLGWPPG
ncbi:MAG: histidine triad nucleotide-binding protein [Candidatus Sericytochromatia bacterium]|nr:histidine triad nucleotide-binding protein [Candidatus Tanganyikabacteria bacterium]